MKPLVIAVALFGGTSAWAQSSVGIGGIVDQAARYVRNDGVGSMKSLASGANATGRIYIRGDEDLGDGLSAGFWLESALGADTGTAGTSTAAVPGQFWDRNSYLHLTSKSVGQLRLGYDQTQIYKAWAIGDPFGNVGIGSNQNVYALSAVTAVGAPWGSTSINATTLSRARNMIAYYVPRNSLGVYGGLAVAAPEGAAATTGQAKLLTGLVGYAGKALDVALGMSDTKTSLTGENSVRELMIRGMYDFGFAKFSAATRQWRYLNSSEKVYHVGAWIPIGVAVIKASYNKVDNAGTSGPTNLDPRDASQLAIGAEYYLSKRTLFYATYARLMNKGTSALTVPGGPAGMPAGGTSSGAEAGIRHNF
jgi:predicted porin